MIISNNFPQNYKYRVISFREQSSYHDSDWYADIVKNDGSIETILYQTTRSGMYGKAEIDIIPFLAVKRFKLILENKIEVLKKQNIEQSKEIAKNRVVEVVKGRKVKKGTKGVVFYMKENNFGSITVGIIDNEGRKHWTYDNNIEVVNPSEYELQDYRLYAKALKLAYNSMPYHTRKYLDSFLI